MKVRILSLVPTLFTSGRPILSKAQQSLMVAVVIILLNFDPAHHKKSSSSVLGASDL